MRYADLLRERFPDLDPDVGDLYLLEAHQIAALPARAPARELAAVLHAQPGLHRFLCARHPPVESFLTRLLADHGPAGPTELPACEQALLWEIADWIVYQREPARYDETGTDADLAAIVDLVALDGKVVIDAGAGTGRLACEVAPAAHHVFAVEPVASLRRYLRQKATDLGLGNLFVLDGFLHAVPLPDETADVLLTRQAIGWDLPAELREIDRLMKPGGIALHLTGMPHPAPADDELDAALRADGYQPGDYREDAVRKRRYWKRISG